MLYFYPNKPILIHPDSPQIKEKSDDHSWWAEVKKNGTRLCLRKDKQEASKHKSFNNFVFWNRHKEVLNYDPSQSLLDELNSFKIPEGTHIDAELMHFKTKNIKNLIYVYDIYWYKGIQVTETLETRRKMIEDIFGIESSKHFEVAKKFDSDFVTVFKEVTIQEENEGIVMKSKKGLINWNLKVCPEVWWQLKVRKPSKSYQF